MKREKQFEETTTVGRSRRSRPQVSRMEKRSLAMTDPDLVRLVDAQASVYEQVVEELTEGHKRTHWMWFIFPQLAGLGHSPLAQRYAIRDLNQAKRYLSDPLLGSRLRQDMRLVVRHKDKSALERFSALPTISSSVPVLPSLPKLPQTTPTGRCSKRPCTNSTMAPILEPCSC